MARPTLTLINRLRLNAPVSFHVDDLDAQHRAVEHEVAGLVEDDIGQPDAVHLLQLSLHGHPPPELHVGQLLLHLLQLREHLAGEAAAISTDGDTSRESLMCGALIIELLILPFTNNAIKQIVKLCYNMCYYLRIENAEGYVLIAVYLFIYLCACYSHNTKSIKPNRMKFGGMIGYYPGTI